jgi:predicted AlkP superfamily pyrophosphatase or phosphodiesterase
MIAIDQFRADYLTRFEDLYLPAKLPGGRVGGFRWMMEQGASHVDAHHVHIPVATGPGHSVLMTGCPPYRNGIVGNNWFVPATGKDLYCVQDDTSPQINSAEKQGISAKNLLVTTLGDELKLSTGGRSKVWGIAIKDRAGVLMAGHLADGVYWTDEDTGQWATSTAYRKDRTLHPVMDAINKEAVPAKYFGRTWDLSVPASALERLPIKTDAYASNPSKLGTKFPHKVDGGLDKIGPNFFKAFALTPWAIDYVLNSSLRIVKDQQLGQDAITDVLAINLSTNDYVGHAYGPYSPEVLDISVATDRAISNFLNSLFAQVPGGSSAVTVVITADHGVAPNLQSMKDLGFDAGVWSTSDLVKRIEARLDKEFGEDDWVLKYVSPYVWLNQKTIARHNLPRQKVEDAAAEAAMEAAGIYAAYTRTSILHGALPQTELARAVYRGFHPQVSGDIALISRAFFLGGSTALPAKGASHTEFFTYDTRVPILLAGFGVKRGVYTERAATIDIAPTLAYLAKVNQPSGSEGHILPSVSPRR